MRSLHELYLRCPKHLKPAQDISNMRKEATKAGLTNNKGVRHAVAFKEDLYKTGRLKEVSMSLKSDGVVDSAKQAFYALRLVETQRNQSIRTCSTSKTCKWY